MPTTVGPIEMMIIYLLPPLIIAGAILWAARSMRKRNPPP
jgi:hypothetical protein